MIPVQHSSAVRSGSSDGLSQPGTGSSVPPALWPIRGNGYRVVSATDGVKSAGLESDTDRKIQLTIAYMREHVDQPLQVATLAARANISLSHFFALFKQRTGCTPIDYFIHLRIQRACELLEATSLTIKEVAAALGYDDPFYFSRVFKSIHAVAPTEYRLARQGMKPAARAGIDGEDQACRWSQASTKEARTSLPLELMSAG
jgi:AraC-like DNA-binding protein